MGIREDVLALAGDVESTIGGCYGCLLDKRGLCKAETDFDCNDEVCKFVAHRLRAIVEHEAEDVTTVSAYDLLPEDEREAIAWVREQGGLDLVKAFVHQGAVEHGFLLKIVEMLGTSIYDGTSNADALLDKLEKRLMPEGIEWPRYEDGEPVRVGDKLMTSDGAVRVEELSLTICDTDGGVTCVPFGERVKRPQVLAADGEPLEVGQTVWHVGNGVEFTVIGLPNPGEYQAVKLRLDDGAFTGLDPDQLTHQRPVLDADGNRIEPAMDVWWICEGDELGIHAEKLHVESIGEDGFVECSPFNGGTWVELDSTELYVHKPVLDADGVPIREGDTVYALGFGEPLTVKGFTDDGRVLMSFHDENSLGYKPSRLIHEQPDTWERIEEDKDLNPFDYCKKVGHKLWTFDNAEEFKASDIVRRCRALAERGE